ncbi:MAG: alpha/beta hydrolase [Cyanobacteria bacterium P01_B01_bin.77]
MEPLFWPSTGQTPIRNLRRQLKHGQLFWREVGRGYVVVFLHGSWHDGDQWSEVLSQLGPQYHCLVPDLIGFGESVRLRDQTNYSIAMQVNTLAELLASLRLGPVILVGHSLGAWVAARYAIQYPDQVTGLCVLEPEGLVYEPQRWRRERWLASPLGSLWLSLTKPFARKSASGQRPSWLQNHHLQQRLKRHPAACRLLFQRRRNELEPEIIGSQLATLPIPMVVLQGEDIETTNQNSTQTFTMAAPNAVVKVLPGNEELPSYASKAVADFLAHWLPRV